jgi:hypothetical protein
MGSSVNAAILLGTVLRRDQDATPVASSRARAHAGDRERTPVRPPGCRQKNRTVKMQLLGLWHSWTQGSRPNAS